MDKNRNIVVVAIDGLRASALGAYGAALCETPALDRLASESFVFDQMLIDRPDLYSLYRGYWQGLHALAPEAAGLPLPSLPQLLADRGFQTMLLTDDARIAEHTLANEFAEVQLLPPGEAHAADDIAQTQLARVFAQGLQVLEELVDRNAPFCFWLHAQGFFAPWDGPFSLRESLADDEDPTPPRVVEVPERRLPADADPDEALGVAQAYGGQTMVLDACLEAFADYWRGTSAADETLLVVLGVRGFPLGEHGRIGLIDEALYSELIHVPVLCRNLHPDAAGFRSSALVQPADLFATLVDWTRGAEEPTALPAADADSRLARGISWLPLAAAEQEQFREALLSVGAGGERALRTSEWHLRWRQKEAIELFVKPDDRWEANEVSNRCADVVASLGELAEHLEAAIVRNETELPAPPAS